MPLSHIQPHTYAAQLAAKQQRLQALFPALPTIDCEVHGSRPMHYRMRAEFRIWHQDGRCHYAMFDPQTPKTPQFLQGFPVACEAIDTLMPVLLDAINHQPVLSRRLFQCEFLASTTGDCLVSLIYRSPLGDAWQQAATALAGQLGIAIVGRSRGQKCVIGRDWIEERMVIDGREWCWQQPEGTFTQPNAGTNQAMLDWACRQAAGLPGDLLELYCGIGNFTLPLSACFRRVLATEVSKTAYRAAEKNLGANNVGNTALARLSSAEAASALRGERLFRRLADIALADYDFRCLLVDPPRAGLDESTRRFAADFEHILYISCNPETLVRDVNAWAATHRIRQAALFDQFPYTHHMECGLLLERFRP